MLTFLFWVPKMQKKRIRDWHSMQNKIEAGTAIFNGYSKTASAGMSACSRPIGVGLTIATLNDFHEAIFKTFIVSVFWLESEYTMKYSLNPREIPRARPEGFPKGSDYISSNIPTEVTIQTFSITILALTFLGNQYWKIDFPYCSDSWAIRENIAQ